MIRIPLIQLADSMNIAVLYDLWVGNKSVVYPSGFQAVFHIMQNKYDDVSKECDKVGCIAVYGREWLASIYIIMYVWYSRQ